MNNQTEGLESHHFVVPQGVCEPGQPEGPDRFGGYEPYVDEFVIADFLGKKPRRVLELTREGEIPGHPFGRTRKTWRYRISEVEASIAARKNNASSRMSAAVPGTQERKH